MLGVGQVSRPDGQLRRSKGAEAIALDSCVNDNGGFNYICSQTI